MPAAPGVESKDLILPLSPGERWWGGAVADGTAMPFGSAHHHRDLASNAGYVDEPAAGANQSAPLLISDRGRYVWSDEPFAFTFSPGRLTLRGSGIEFGAGDSTGDQFTLGGRILVAPVLHPGATTRRVRLPPGSWTAPDGTRYDGPAELTVPVTLTTIPWYRRG